MPCASRESFESAWSCAKSRNSRTAISVVISPATTIPARKMSGSRTRSDPKRAIALVLRRFPLGVLRRRHLVADAPHGDDRRCVAELAAQLADVHVDRARVACEGVAPHALEQLVARQHEAAVIEQLPEEIELLRRELDLFLADAHLAPARVDVQVAVLDRLGLEVAAVRGRATQDRLHARDELARVERLRQVVVRADLE